MYDLHRWVIYDSRVAWALASLLHHWSRDTPGPPIRFRNLKVEMADHSLGLPRSQR